MPLGQTPALQIDLMAEGDNQKWLLFNDAIQALEDSYHKELAVNMSGGGVTLTEAEITGNAVFTCSGHATARTLTIPDTVGTPPVATNRVFFVKNDGTGTGTVTVSHSAGATVDVGINQTAIVRADGTDIVTLGSTGQSLSDLGDTTIGSPVDYQSLVFESGVWINSNGNFRIVNDQVGTTYSFVLSDQGKQVRFDNAAAITATVEPDSTTDHPIGTTILVRQVGAGAVTIAEGVSVTINTPDDLILGAPGESATLLKVAANEWDLIKDLTTAAQNLSVNDQSGTSYTFALTDADTQVRLTNAAAITATVPPNSTTAFPIGSQIRVIQSGAGTVTIAAGAGVTLNSPDGLVFRNQYETILLTKVGTDVWDVWRSRRDRFVMEVPVSDEINPFTNGTAKITFRVPAVDLTEVRAHVSTANTSGGPVTVDINEGGVSILSTKLTIDDTEKTSTTAATPPVISDASLADDAEMTIDIDSGSNDAVGLKVMLIGYYA